MKKGLLTAAVIGGVLLLGSLTIGGCVVGTYNGFVTKDQNVDTSWAQVETQYQRRFDLIPNLVEATKGVLRQEQAVFGAIAEARKGYAGAAGTAEKARAAGTLDSALARLLVVIENYPQLRSNDTVRDLMTELAGTENRINVARHRYNEAAQDYNTSIKHFPGTVFAGLFGFKAKPYYESVAAAKEAPKVNLDVKS